MSQLSITIDYAKQSVDWEGEINPDTILYLRGMIRWVKAHQDTMDLSSELGGIPIKAEGTSRIELDVEGEE